MLFRLESMMRVWLAAWSCLLVASGAQANISGSFSSPLGALKLKENATGEVTGSIASKSNPCGFPVGKTVLVGSRLDDSVVGTLTLCGVQDCSGERVADVMLLATKGDAVLSGAAHVDGKCTTSLGGDALRMKKFAGKPPPPSVVVVQKPANNANAANPAVDAQGKPVAVKPTPKTPRARAEALANEGLALLKEVEGRVEDARAKFRAAIEADPTFAAAYGGVGVTYYMADRYDEALAQYKLAVEVDPSYYDAYYNMGAVLALLGERDQALNYIRIALLNGYADTHTFREDPDFKSLHGDPVFKRLGEGDLSPIAPTAVTPPATPSPAPTTPAKK
jgi:hypothetical protein